MNANLTEIVFVLDRSGSMAGLASDTIGGFNSFIEKQKKEPGEARLTTILFDEYYEILHNGVDIQLVAPLTDKQYYARGMTALLDAVGKTINTVGERLKNTHENDRPSKVIFVITTDGAENASVEFNASRVKDMITHQTEKYNWQFLYLGASFDNLDAYHEASSIGIGGAYTLAVYGSHGVMGPQGPRGDSGAIGTNDLYDAVSKTVASYRTTGEVSEDWKSEIS